ncbi:MAG: glycosyltransferase [bacterium]
MALSDYSLVMVGCPPFAGMMQRHQQLARRLAKHLPVYYCEETPSVAAIYLKKIGNPADLQGHKKGIVEEAPNLFTYKAPPGMPTFLNFTKANAANMKRTAETLDAALTAKGVTKRILWLGHPRAIEVADHLPHDLLIYDCYDAFGEFEEEARQAEQVKQLEERTIKEADLVFATARNLFKKCVAVNPHSYLVPNGADVAHFSQEHPPKSKKDYGVDIEALKAKGRVVGYIGDMGEWFDHMLLISTAQLNPKISFVFIGPINKKIESLTNLRNTHFTGRVDYQDLPWFLQHFDACIIPFLNTPVTENLNPIKLYEYFATGKPVVTTDFPEIRDFEGLLAIGNNGRAFYTKLEMELNLSGNTPQKAHVIEKRKEIAALNSWEARVAQITDLFEHALAKDFPAVDPAWSGRPGALAAQWRNLAPAVPAVAVVVAHDHDHDDHHH